MGQVLTGMLRLKHERYFFPFAVPVNIRFRRPRASGWCDCHQFLGDLSEEDPPVPIPNTVVKLLSPDGTARATVWESRKSPGYNHQSLPVFAGRLFGFGVTPAVYQVFTRVAFVSHLTAGVPNSFAHFRGGVV